MMASAMEYAMKKGPSHVNGYNMSLTILNSEDEKNVREKILKTFTYDYSFIVGPFSSETSYIGSILTGTFKSTAISYSATYSDFSKHGMDEGYMLRTVPSDTYRIEAALRFIEHMKWNYIGVVSSFNYNGERDASKFIPKLRGVNACLAVHIHLKNNAQLYNYTSILETLVSDDRLKTLVLFTTREDSRQFFIEINKLNLTRRYYILCMYGSTNYVEVTEGIEEIVTGVISLDVHCPEVRGFKDYFLKQKPTRYSPEYFKKYWENIFTCTFSNTTGRNSSLPECTGEEILTERNYYSQTPVATIFNAVSIIQYTFKNIIETLCQKKYNNQSCFVNPNESHKLAKFIFRRTKLVSNVLGDGTTMFNSPYVGGDPKKIRFDFHQFISRSKDLTQNNLIGSWSIQVQPTEIKPGPEPVTERENGVFVVNNDWNKTNGKQWHMRAMCSEACDPGYVREKDIDVSKNECCWRCEECPSNSIVIENKCVACEDVEKADIYKNTCKQLPVHLLNFDNTVTPYIMTMFCTIGLILDIIVVGFFIKYNNYPLVKASGRDLCYLILIGIGIIFLSPFLFIQKPTLQSCIVRSGLPGIAFLCCYAPLFLKIQRIYRIFTHAKNSVKRPHMVGTRSLLLLSLGFIIAQIVLTGVWFLSNTPLPIAFVADSNEFVTIHCDGDTNPILLFLNMAISVMFMLACTVLAYKTRHYPKNYNEAKHIGITLYITCVAWSIFIPAYFLLPESDYVREYFMCGICIVIGYVTLFGLFGYKIRLLTCQRHIKTSGEHLPTWFLSQHSSHTPTCTEHVTQFTTDNFGQSDSLM